MSTGAGCDTRINRPLVYAYRCGAKQIVFYVRGVGKRKGEQLVLPFRCYIQRRVICSAFQYAYVGFSGNDSTSIFCQHNFFPEIRRDSNY